MKQAEIIQRLTNMMGDASGIITPVSVRHISQPTIMTILPSNLTRRESSVHYGIILNINGMVR
jgi:hypothetical protein